MIEDQPYLPTLQATANFGGGKATRKSDIHGDVGSSAVCYIWYDTKFNHLV